MRGLPHPGILVVIALALRLVGAFEARSDPTFDSPIVDAWGYDRAARQIVEDGPGALEVPYYQPPLYVFFLAVIYGASEGSWLAPRLVQALLGALTVGFVAAVAGAGAGGAAGDRTRGRRAAWMAGGLMALHGPALFFEGELLPPTLILTLSTAAILLLIRADRTVAPGQLLAGAAGAGLLLGLSTVTRPTALLFALAAVWWWLRGGRTRARIRALTAGAIAFALPILPITIANRVGGGETIPISWNGGINLWLGNGAGSDSLTAIQPGFAWDRLQVDPLRVGVTSRRGESAYWVRRAAREAGADPTAWFGALGRKTLRLLDAQETPRNVDYRAVREVSRFLGLPWSGFGIVAPLALLGWLLRGAASASSRRSRDPDRERALLGWALAAVAVENLLFFPTGRYRLEAVPALCVLAGLGVDGALRAGRGALRLPAVLTILAFTAVVHLDLLGEREIDRTRVAVNEGVAHRHAGRSGPAAAAIRRALELSPGDADAHRWAGEMALETEDPQTALRHFEAALAAEPDYVRVLQGSAQALERAGRRPEAEAVYRRALEADPWETGTRLNFGVFLAVEGRLDEARGQFERGLRIDPTDGPLRRNLDRLDRQQTREGS